MVDFGKCRKSYAILPNNTAHMLAKIACEDFGRNFKKIAWSVSGSMVNRYYDTFIDNAALLALENLYDPEVSVSAKKNKLRFQRQEVAGNSLRITTIKLHVNFCSTLIH